LTGTTATKRVRDRLIDAAEVCLRAKGIRSTTVSEVAEVAGVSRGWLYRHFPDKLSLVGAAIVRLNDAYWSEAHAVLEQVDETRALAAFRSIRERTERLVATLPSCYEYLTHMRQESAKPAAKRRRKAALAKAVSERPAIALEGAHRERRAGSGKGGEQPQA